MARTILRLAELSERTGIPVSTFRWYRHQGIGPKTFLLGGKVVAFEDDLEVWLDEQRDKSAV